MRLRRLNSVTISAAFELGVEDALADSQYIEELLISGNEKKTSNPRIFKSNESFLSLEKLNEIINDILEAIMDNNTNRITEIMTKYVDGFKYE